MCGRYELRAGFEKFPSILKRDLPKGFQENYAQRALIQPNEPVLVLKNEGKTTTSLMLWGFISEWAKDPFDHSMPRPFNARAETIDKKRLFQGGWRHKRCLIPASGFFEKNYRVRRKDSKVFWLAGIWNRWMSNDGSELESCCIITTKPNTLIRPLHNRMPVIIPNGVEEDWIEPGKTVDELKALQRFLTSWDPKDWITDLLAIHTTFQMDLF